MSATRKTQVNQERRSSPRLAGRLRVVVVSGRVVFRTFSYDISEGGIRLEKPVPPELVSSVVDIFVSSPEYKSSLRFKARLIPDQADAFRFQFIAQGAEVHLLTQWVQSLNVLKRAG
jgi:hypothetical protein